MNILFAGNKNRGASCLKALIKQGHRVCAVVAHPASDGERDSARPLVEGAESCGLPLLRPQSVNDPDVLEHLRALGAQITVLAGYGPILGPEAIALTPLGCINLHGGKLPQYRGSSPMNWALINGEKTFTLSVLQVDAGIDSGDILAEMDFPIQPEDTIADLQRKADEAFPALLLGVLHEIASGTMKPRKQRSEDSAYWPLRFPEDGLILWDQLTAEQAHNRIRALTRPYTGAFGYYDGRKVFIYRSRMTDQPYMGEPGRVYAVRNGSVLVCAQDRCLWLDETVYEDDPVPLNAHIKRYAKLATLRDLALQPHIRVFAQ